MLYRLDGLYDEALADYDHLLALNPSDVVLVGYNRGARLHPPGRLRPGGRGAGGGARGRARAPADQDLPGRRLLQPGTGGRGAVADGGGAARRARTSTACSPCWPGAWPRAGEHDTARALITDRVQETAKADSRHRVLAGLLLRHGGHGGRGHGVAAPSVRLGNENYPLFAGQPQAGHPARRPARSRELVGALKARCRSGCDRRRGRRALA